MGSKKTKCSIKKTEAIIDRADKRLFQQGHIEAWSKYGSERVCLHHDLCTVRTTMTALHCWCGCMWHQNDAIFTGQNPVLDSNPGRSRSFVRSSLFIAWHLFVQHASHWRWSITRRSPTCLLLECSDESRSSLFSELCSLSDAREGMSKRIQSPCDAFVCQEMRERKFVLLDLPSTGIAQRFSFSSRSAYSSCSLLRKEQRSQVALTLTEEQVWLIVSYAVIHPCWSNKRCLEDRLQV